MIIKKNILITGHKGYVASFFIKKFKNNFNFYSINKKGKLFFCKNNKIINKYDILFDTVLHLASIHKFPDFTKNNKENYYKNIKSFNDAVKFAGNNIDNFFFTSTIDCGRKNFPSFKKIYIQSKLHIEKKLREYYKKKIIKRVIILRIPSILNNKSNIFINKLILDIKNNKLLFNGLPRNFNSITTKEDISNFFYSVIKKRYKTGFYILNFCCRIPIKMIDFLTFVRNKFNHKVNINVRKTSERSIISCKKLFKNFNFNTTTVNKALKNYLKKI